MRAREFVVEYKTEEYNGLRFSTDIKNGQLIVRALDDWGTNELGHVVFNIGDQDELDPQDLEVDDRYQGQGIARTMYDYVKTLGYKIHRSYDQTPAGAGFWNKHRGTEERVWEGVAEAVHSDVTSKKYFIDPTENVRMGDFEFNARTFTGALGSPNAKGLQIRAYDPKNLKRSIGSADFIVKSDRTGNQWLESDDTEVNDEYRGKGIATMMYAFARSLDNDIKRSPYQSKAGSDMWNKWGNDANHLALAEDRGQGAAGIILYAKDTGRYGLQQRSDSINDGGLWAAWGGGREPGESLEQCARRELAEESGYTGAIELHHLADNPRYTTFIGVVPSEFEPRPDPEWQDYCWVEAGDWPAPMHPGVAAALKNIPVNEAFNNPYKTKLEKSEYGDIDMLAKLPDGTNLSIMFNNQQDDEGKEIVQVEFYRNNSQEVTGEGDAQRIFATVLASIQKYIKKYKPARLSFSASKATDPTIYYEPGQPQPNPESRAKLYDRLVQRYARSWGYRAFRADTGDLVIYELSRANPVAENFADGKNPQDKGDSKRHGINTKASVSSLRKTAKQGGRKGQLAHWLANMKSGRAKAKRK